jgi:hypothetical protein
LQIANYNLQLNKLQVCMFASLQVCKFTKLKNLEIANLHFTNCKCAFATSQVCKLQINNKKIST